MAVNSDLSGFLVEAETADMVVENPKTAGDPMIGSDGNPWTITWAGPDHPVMREFRHATIKRTQKLERRGIDESPEVLEERSVEYLTARCIAWTPVVLEGKEFVCNEENKRKLFSTQWATRQANKFLNAEGNFIAGSANKPSRSRSTSSGSTAA